MLVIKLHVLCLILMAVGRASHIPKLILTPKQHHLVLFTHAQQRINFKIDFTLTETFISKDYGDVPLYLEKGGKKKISDKMSFKVQNIKKSLDEEDQGEDYDGVVGMKAQGDFFKGLKAALGLDKLKLWVKMYENEIEIIPEGCHAPIPPPYEIQIQTPTSRYYQSVEYLSFNFYPSMAGFLDMLKKTSSPFTASRSELQMRLNLQFFNQIQSVQLQTLLGGRCLKMSESDSYECNINQKNKHFDGRDNHVDPGRLLFEFDPLICTEKNAIQLRQEGKVDSEGYYWSHLLLIGSQFSFLYLFMNRQKLRLQINYILGQRKFPRSH